MKKTSNTPTLAALLVGGAVGAILYANRETLAKAGVEAGTKLADTKVGASVLALTKPGGFKDLMAKFGPLFAANDADARRKAA
jgi:hypothetical protein